MAIMIKRGMHGRRSWTPVRIFAAAAITIVLAVPIQAQDATRPLALTNVNVISTLDGKIERNATILIEGNRIRRVIRDADARSLPKGVRVVSFANKYVIPGLWDMHVHSMLNDQDPDWFHPLLLINGVTGIRDMGSLVPLARILRVRAEIDAGNRLGPRILVAGPLIDGFNTAWAAPSGAPTSEEAARAVRLLVEQGADFIKVFPLIGQDAYQAIVAEANRLRVPVAGQVPEPVTAAEASNAGQRSIDHLDHIILGCSDAEADIVQIKADVLKRLRMQPGRESLAQLLPTAEETALTLETMNPDRCTNLLALLAQNGTAVVPTLLVSRLYRPAARRMDDPRLNSLPRTVREAWLAMNIMIELGAEDPSQLVTIEYLSRRLVRPLAEAGVPILAGTHAAAITPFIFPGSSLHDELAALVNAGLSPLEALQSATIAPARFANQESDLGTVAAGKLADLVVLDANPLDHISNTRRTHAVVVNGRLLERPDLDALARGVAGMHR